MQTDNDLVYQTLQRAWSDFGKELQIVDLESANESVFRHFFLRCLPREKGIRYETEWFKRVDLFITVPKHPPIGIEFKFYVQRYHYKDEQPTRRKGGPGLKNQEEFWDSWRKLASLPCEIDPLSKYVILVYQESPDDAEHWSYRRSYSQLGIADHPADCPSLCVERLPPISVDAACELQCVLIKIC